MTPTAMTAAPRNNDIHRRCLESVIRAGFSDLTIFCEPGTVLPEVPCSFTLNPARLGQWYNWLQSLEYLVASTDAERVVTLEDDVILCRQVADLVERMVWPSDRCGCLQLYTSAWYSDYPRGLVQLQPEHADDMLGACALCLRRDAAVDLVRWGREKGWRGHTYQSVAATFTRPEQSEGVDTFIGEVLTALGYEIWICNPSLGQHIGDVSTLDHPGMSSRRTGLNWPGEDADALELFPLTERQPCES